MKGKVLGNRYEILEKIGEGGMANVYTARCRILNRIVAVKVLKEEFSSDGEFSLKFREEAQAVASLNHDNIITVYDVGQEEGIPYIVMEYIDGIDIKEFVRQNGKQEEHKALRIVRQIAAALSEAHRKKIIHRDIKPHNIMMTKDNRVKVGDFGIAKAVTQATITTHGDVLGSVHYFSPEQARGGYMDERSDIYSLGIVLYELLTGQVPFSGETPVNVAMKHIHNRVELPVEEKENISENTITILKKMTQRNIDKRYASVDDLINDIDETNKGQNIYPVRDYQQEFETKKILFSKAERDRIQATEFDDPDEVDDAPYVDRKRGQSMRKKQNKSNRRMTIFAIVLALVAALAFLSTVFFASGGNLLSGNLFGSKKMIVPSLLGMTLEQASEEATKLGLVVEKGEEVVNSKYEPGTITEQKPGEGKKVKAGDVIVVTLSKKEEEKLKEVDLPDVSGKKIDEAETVLDNLGLYPITNFEYSSDVPEDAVISQEPVSGTKVKEGSEVVLKVSRGKEEILEKVPNFVGSSISQAKASAGNFKLDIGEKEDKSVADGQILSQNPKAGVDAKQGSTVTVIVNKIEKPKEPELITRNLLLTLPEKDQVHVQIKDTATGAPVYDKTVQPSAIDGILSLNMVGKAGETKHFEIYFDTDFIGTQTITFE